MKGEMASSLPAPPFAVYTHTHATLRRNAIRKHMRGVFRLQDDSAFPLVRRAFALCGPLAGPAVKMVCLTRAKSVRH